MCRFHPVFCVLFQRTFQLVRLEALSYYLVFNAVFSDIFQVNTFGELTFDLDLKSLFPIQHTNHSICSQCNQQMWLSCKLPIDIIDTSELWL